MVNSEYQVHTTTDYFLFRSLQGNRKKKPLHLARLKESMSENYLFTVIIVNENYEIIDGQHRFECIKELKLPLHYIVCQGYGLDEVHILNQNSKNWNADDYMDGYCGMGKKDYIIYRDFKQKYKFGHNECMAMLSGNITGGGSLVKSFHRGDFKVTHFKKAERLAEKICLLGNLYDGYKKRSFVWAMLELLNKEDFEFTEFLQKLKLQPSALTDCSNKSQYISLIEEIYNYRRRNKVNLRY